MNHYRKTTHIHRYRRIYSNYIRRYKVIFIGWVRNWWIYKLSRLTLTAPLYSSVWTPEYKGRCADRYGSPILTDEYMGDLETGVSFSPFPVRRTLHFSFCRSPVSPPLRSTAALPLLASAPPHPPPRAAPLARHRRTLHRLEKVRIF
jgi:hypothetical protein